jgi:serine/threonine-protein kinase
MLGTSKRQTLSRASVAVESSRAMTNPYSPPTVDVATVEPIPEVPPAILKKIKSAWMAGIVSGCMTLLITLLAASGTKVLGFDAWNFVDVALIAGLTFGIYRKSRVCAVLMLIYFAISKIMIALDGGKASGIGLSLVFLYFYAQGVVGTFAYHKQVKA